MLLTEWNTDDAIKVQRQEAFEDGIKLGEQRGIKLGEQRSAAVIAAKDAEIAALRQRLAMK
jgi:flagellar biosynthesis/type III secretory pathway protein FliH